jgi:DNA recombination protein RmuC
MSALARHIGQVNKDVEEVHISSRKISAHFQRIESARLDEPDEIGDDNALEEPEMG